MERMAGSYFERKTSSCLAGVACVKVIVGLRKLESAWNVGGTDALKRALTA